MSLISSSRGDIDRTQVDLVVNALLNSGEDIEDLLQRARTTKCKMSGRQALL